MKLGSLIGAVGVAGILALFGYLSLRAHWNHLGIAAPAGVGAERYAQETYQIVLSSVQWLALIALAAAVPIVVIRLIVRAVARRSPRAAAISLTLTPKLLPLLLLLTLIVVEIAVLRITSPPASPTYPNVQCSSDIALGALREKAAAGCYTPRPGLPTFLAALLVTIAAFVLTAAAEPTLLQKLVWLAALAMALQLPIVYGYAVKPPLYRVARLTVADHQLVGILVLQTSDAIELWDATAAYGRMIIVSAHDVKSMESGAAVDLENVITTVAADPSGDRFQQLCNTTLSNRGQ